MSWVIIEKYQTELERFRSYLITMGYNAHGIKIKCHQLTEFFRQQKIKGKEDTKEIKEEDIRTYHHYIKHRPNKLSGDTLRDKTVYEYLSVVDLYYRMLLEQGQITTSPMNNIKIPYPKHKIERKILSEEEIKALYEAAEDALERAILSLAYGCGMRVSEIVQSNIEDVKLKEAVIIIPKGKNNKRRVVPLSQGVKKDLEEYLDEYRMHENTMENTKNNTSLVLNKRGRRMQKDTYNRILKQILERSSIKDKQISMHNLRHSIASHLLEGGMPLQQVRQFLGHDQMETTEVYTHIHQRQIKKMILDK